MLALRERDSVPNYNNLARMLATEDKLREAEPYLKVALAILDKPGADNPELLKDTLDNYAELLSHLKRPAEAAKLSSRAKRLSNSLQPDAAAK